MNQKQLLMYIAQVSFALTEANLYLDTHPCDQDAMDYYRQVKKLRKEALEKYQSQFGPLLNDGVRSDTWDWVDAPWPWESGL